MITNAIVKCQATLVKKRRNVVHLHSAKRLVDLRELGEVIPLFEPHDFLRISREAAVNLRRIRDIRLRPSGRDWEVKLEPPVNKVLPVSRSLLSSLWQAYEVGK
ncbi:MAG: LytTR family transcriptional regulator DNA-binding domain-containing protein [Thermoanaerobaculia bacterium]